MVKWEIPDEPEGVHRVWTPDETGDGWIEWRKDAMPITGNRRYWRKASDSAIRGGPGVWHTWMAVLEQGPVTDENPFPPELGYDPQSKAIFLKMDSGKWTPIYNTRRQDYRAEVDEPSGLIKYEVK